MKPGSRIGPFEIVAPLGSGGMGEVYRAIDTRLERAVAIKILPAEFSTHSERLLRFEQEAKSASALNHPNIVTIYELGRDGSSQHIAMELVAGKTLRQLMQSGLLPIRQILDVATQVAEGLTKAHDAGITHRDLKPENLMVTDDGLVKILDFGLAKLVDPSSGSATNTHLSSDRTSLTSSGVVVGTVNYMSPEQAEGARTDFRSDQFALGLVLYELVTGRRPFSPHRRNPSSPSCANHTSRSSLRSATLPRRSAGPSSDACKKILRVASPPRVNSRANSPQFATAFRNPPRPSLKFVPQLFQLRATVSSAAAWKPKPCESFLAPTFAW